MLGTKLIKKTFLSAISLALAIAPTFSSNAELVFKKNVRELVVTAPVDSGSGSNNNTSSLTVSTNVLSFGTKLEGSVSTLSLSVINSGTTAVTISSITASAPFSATTSCQAGGTLASSASCTITVAFAPQIGSYSGVVTVQSSAGTKTISVSGTGQALSHVLDSSTSNLNFGSLLQGNSSAVQSVVLQNNGTGPISFSNITTPSPFSSTTNCSLETPLEPGQSCSVEVTYTAGAGSAQGDLTITSTAGNKVITLQGNGLLPLTVALSGLPHDIVAPQGAMGAVEVGQHKDLNVFILRSGDVGTLNISAAITGGSNKFKLISAKAINTYYQAGYDWTYESTSAANCALTDNYHVNCAEYSSNGTAYNNILVTLRYTPDTIVNSEAANLTITHNGSNSSPLSIALTASSFGAPNVQTSASSVIFDGSTNVSNIGATTSSQAISVYNSGTLSTTISSVVLKSGSNSAFGTPITTCTAGFVLAAGNASNCVFTVPFTPVSTAPVTGTIQVTTADGTVKEVSLTGTGQGASGALAADTANGSSTNFGTLMVGGSSQQVFVFTNNGNVASTNTYATTTGADLSVASGSCGTQSAPIVLAAGASCSFTVSYTPTSATTLTNASVSVVSSAYNSPSSLTVSGSAGAANIVTYGASRRYADGTYATSCNAYRNSSGNYVYSGATGDGTYTIDVDGSGAAAPVDVTCDMTTDGGGWTKVQEFADGGIWISYSTNSAPFTVSVDDKNLNYSSAMMVSSSMLNGMDYSALGDGAWYSRGFNMSITAFKFSGTWYVRSDAPGWRGNGSSSTSPYGITASGVVSWPASNYTTLLTVSQYITQNNVQGADTYCQFGTTSSPTYCAATFKVAVPSGKRLQYVSDIETIANGAADNKIRRNYSIWLK